jgi:hypothetical protein
MYEIYHEQDGSYRCVGKLQDGSETRCFQVLDDAVAWLVEFARFMNHDDIMPSDITYLESQVAQIITYDRTPIPAIAKKQPNPNDVRQ